MTISSTENAIKVLEQQNKVLISFNLMLNFINFKNSSRKIEIKFGILFNLRNFNLLFIYLIMFYFIQSSTFSPSRHYPVHVVPSALVRQP